MRRTILVSLALLLASAGPATAIARSFHDGVYGRISYSAETDDRDGVQLTLHLSAKSATIDFLLCEGGCGAVVTTRARPVGDTLEFEISEQFVDLQGRPTSSATTHYVIKPSGSGVRLSASGDRTFSDVYLPAVHRRER